MDHQSVVVPAQQILGEQALTGISELAKYIARRFPQRIVDREWQDAPRRVISTALDLLDLLISHPADMPIVDEVARACVEQMTELVDWLRGQFPAEIRQDTYGRTIDTIKLLLEELLLYRQPLSGVTAAGPEQRVPKPLYY